MFKKTEREKTNSLICHFESIFELATGR